MILNWFSHSYQISILIIDFKRETPVPKPSHKNIRMRKSNWGNDSVDRITGNFRKWRIRYIPFFIRTLLLNWGACCGLSFPVVYILIDWIVRACWVSTRNWSWLFGWPLLPQGSPFLRLGTERRQFLACQPIFAQLFCQGNRLGPQEFIASVKCWGFGSFFNLNFFHLDEQVIMLSLCTYLLLSCCDFGGSGRRCHCQ